MRDQRFVARTLIISVQSLLLVIGLVPSGALAQTSTDPTVPASQTTSADTDTPSAEPADTYLPRVLPGSPFYGFKRFFEGTQLFFTLGSENKAELHRIFADKRLSEADRLLELDRPQRVPDTLKDFQEELTPVTAHIESQVEAGDISSVALVEELRKMTARHEAVLYTDAIKVDPEIEDELLEAADAAQEALDLCADARGDQPIPEEVLTDLTQLNATGILTDTDLSQLVSAPDRRSARELMNKLLNEEGTLAIPDVLAIEEHEIRAYFPEEAEKFTAAIQFRTVKNIVALPYFTAPTEEEQQKISAFMAAYTPGTEIPEDIRRFVIPQIRGLEFAAQAPTTFGKLSPSDIRSVDQDLLKAMLVTFNDTLGSSLPSSGDSPFGAVSLDLAKTLYGKMQESFAKYVGLDQFDKYKDQYGGDEEAAKQAFLKERAGLLTSILDTNVAPPGWSPDEWKKHVDLAKQQYLNGPTAGSTGVAVPPGVDHPAVGGIPVVFAVTPPSWAKPPADFKPYDTDQIREKELEWTKKYQEVQLDFEKKRQDIYFEYDKKRQDYAADLSKKLRDDRYQEDTKRWEQERRNREADFARRDTFQADPTKFTEEQRKRFEEEGKRRTEEAQKNYQEYFRDYQQAPFPTPTYQPPPAGSGAGTTGGQPYSPSYSPSYAPSYQPGSGGASYSPSYSYSPAPTASSPTYSYSPSPSYSYSEPSPSYTYSPAPTTSSPSYSYSPAPTYSTTTASPSPSYSSSYTYSPTPSSSTSYTYSPTPTETYTPHTVLFFTDRYSVCVGELGYTYPLTLDQRDMVERCVAAKTGS